MIHGNQLLSEENGNAKRRKKIRPDFSNRQKKSGRAGMQKKPP